MWQLDYKESWVMKNWCFCTVVLEKTLESPQPVYPKGNQSWIFIGRTDVEAESPIMLPTWWEELHQGLFKWVSSSHQVAKVLEFQLQHQSCQWIFRTDFLEEGLVGSPCSPRDSQVFSNTTVQKHQFFSAQLSLYSNSHIHTWPLEKP